jgi:hypothetical protein
MLFIPVLGADIVRCLRRLSRANRKEPRISKFPLRKENAFFLSKKIASKRTPPSMASEAKGHSPLGAFCS